jgi:hypothetical protein
MGNEKGFDDKSADIYINILQSLMQVKQEGEGPFRTSPEPPRPRNMQRTMNKIREQAIFFAKLLSPCGSIIQLCAMYANYEQCLGSTRSSVTCSFIHDCPIYTSAPFTYQFLVFFILKFHQHHKYAFNLERIFDIPSDAVPA